MKDFSYITLVSAWRVMKHKKEVGIIQLILAWIWINISSDNGLLPNGTTP